MAVRRANGGTATRSAGRAAAGGRGRRGGAVTGVPNGSPTLAVVRPGDTSKPDPYTIAIVANPALETPWNSGKYAVDPIVGRPAAFAAAVRYVDDALFGSLPNQKEQFLNDPSIAGKIRVVSLRVTGLARSGANALVGQDPASNIAVPLRSAFAPFLARYGVQADVAFAVTASPTHTRASAYYTSDDDVRGGVPFTLDGAALVHRYYWLVPGTVALPTSSRSLTALHEFGHAASSYSNGGVTDLYVDSQPDLNVKVGRPIPPGFANYDGTAMASDPSRDGIGYPPTWQSYHGGLLAAGFPAVMDNYWMAANNQFEACEHDEITRRFLLDRLRAKTSR